MYTEVPKRRPCILSSLDYHCLLTNFTNWIVQSDTII